VPLAASWSAPPSLALQADGRIVLAFTGHGANGTGNAIYLERLRAGGSPDTSFGNQGLVATAKSQNDLAWSVAVQPNGQFLVGGQQDAPSGSHSLLAARYNSDGSLDTTFGANGIATAAGVLIAEGSGVAMSLQPDGKIVLAGAQDSTASTPYEFALARYLP
jgi:uncharacterized delta-60 repeat protein